MIESADAVASPGAVMVHADDALGADRAVVDSLFLDDVALEAVADYVEELDLPQIDLALLSILASVLLLL